MGDIFNKDFLEFIESLNRFDVKYLLVGGYAVILYGYNRTTGDLDIWVKPTKQNYQNLNNAFRVFGLPTNAIQEKDFLNVTDYDVFTFGRPPVSIDIMTKVKGVKFDSAYNISNVYETNGVKIRLVHYNTLLKSKKASGRLKDKNDILHLEEE